MSAKKITVDNLPVRIESMENDEYVNLTDIAKSNNKTEPRFLLMSWLKNPDTQEFLESYDEFNNPDFKRERWLTFRNEYSRKTAAPTAKKLLAQTQMKGMISKSGRYGGTWAVMDIAINFMFWLSPRFQVWFIKEFRQMKSREEQQALQERSNMQLWMLQKIEDSALQNTRFAADLKDIIEEDKKKLESKR